MRRRGALSGRSIILTRSVADSAGLADRLEELGAEVTLVPLNEVSAPADGGAALRGAVADLASYDWVVLTSASGVAFLADAMVRRKVERFRKLTMVSSVTWPESVSVAVVGEATAAAAIEAGLPCSFQPSEATAACLVREFPSSLKGGRVLAPLAELASSTVTEGLTAKGYDVDQVIAYRTSAPAIDPVIEPGICSTVLGADVVVLASPSAAARFVERFGVLGRAQVVCIGPSTSRRASSLGLSVAASAMPHNNDGLFDAVYWLLVTPAG